RQCYEHVIHLSTPIHITFSYSLNNIDARITSPLSLHDALPILDVAADAPQYTTAKFGEVPLVDTVATHDEETGAVTVFAVNRSRSEEHTSELQSRFDLVCRLLLEKKTKNLTVKTTIQHQKKSKR